MQVCFLGQRSSFRCVAWLAPTHVGRSNHMHSCLQVADGRAGKQALRSVVAGNKAQKPASILRFLGRAFVWQWRRALQVRHNPSVEARPNGICLAPTRRSATFSASRAQAKYRWPRLTSNVRARKTGAVDFSYPIGYNRSCSRYAKRKSSLLGLTL